MPNQPGYMDHQLSVHRPRLFVRCHGGEGEYCWFGISRRLKTDPPSAWCLGRVSNMSPADAIERYRGNWLQALLVPGESYFNACARGFTEMVCVMTDRGLLVTSNPEEFIMVPQQHGPRNETAGCGAKKEIVCR